MVAKLASWRAMYFVYLLLVFGHLVVGDEIVECWEYPCSTIDDGNIIEEVETVNDAKGCQTLCEKNVDCKWFDFRQFHEQMFCTLLKGECTTEPGYNPNAYSGPKTCITCDKKKKRSGYKYEEDLAWICFDKRGIRIDDNRTKLPAGSTCKTECYEAVFSSKCNEGGEWDDIDSSLTDDPTNNARKAKIQKPNERGQCVCDHLTVSLEQDAAFYCTKEIDEIRDAPITIESSNQCALVCDNTVHKHIHCTDGIWRDIDVKDPEEAIELSCGSKELGGN